MQTDIRINWDVDLSEGDFGLTINQGDLDTDEGIETAIIISLFTDRRADDDDILPNNNNTDKRGWWGDQISPEVENDQIGSRLWLLERSKTENSVLIKAKIYIEESLQWLIDDGIASKINVYVEKYLLDRLYFLIEVLRNTDIVYSKKFEYQWNAQLSR